MRTANATMGRRHRLSGAGLTATRSVAVATGRPRARADCAHAEEPWRSNVEARPRFIRCNAFRVGRMVSADLFAKNTILSSLGPQTVNELVGEIELVYLRTHQ